MIAILLFFLPMLALGFFAHNLLVYTILGGYAFYLVLLYVASRSEMAPCILDYYFPSAQTLNIAGYHYAAKPPGRTPILQRILHAFYVLEGKAIAVRYAEDYYGYKSD
jgi:hypothetical protein